MYLNADDYRAQKALQKEERDREELLHLLLYCKTADEVTQARKLRDEWILAHPDDDEVFEASERLEMMVGGYEIEAAQKQAAPVAHEETSTSKGLFKPTPEQRVEIRALAKARGTNIALKRGDKPITDDARE